MEPAVLYFFLSYARGDDDDQVHQFFGDLCAEVRSYAGLDAGKEVGFLDKHSLEIGAPWSPRLMQALSQCQSFVALLSPRYLLSEACGKEWAAFEQRLQQHFETTQVLSSALLPLRWLPPRQLPEAVATRQYDNDNLPDAYTRAGVRQLMRLQRHRDSYWELVSELARLIVHEADLRPLPPATTTLTFEQVTSVFDQVNAAPPELDEPAAAPARPTTRRPHYVHFVVVAPSREELLSAELSASARDAAFYGSRPQEWAPYQPVLPAPLVDYAREIAGRRSFESGVSDIDELAARLALARDNNQIVVLLVDAWVTRLSRHREALARCESEIDEQDQPPAVMVPSSHEDQQTRENWRQLADSLRAIFFRRTVNGDDMLFRTSILSPPAFDADLQVVLEVAKNRGIPSKAPVRRPIPGAAGSGRSSRPIGRLRDGADRWTNRRRTPHRARSSPSTRTRAAPAGPWRSPTLPGSWPATGMRVLAVDWDLESPGLHRYFHPFLRDKELRTSRGVIDLIRDYADAAMRARRGDDEPDWIDRPRRRAAATRSRWTGTFPGDGGRSTCCPRAGRTAPTRRR